MSKIKIRSRVFNCMNNHFLSELLYPKSVAIYGANNIWGTTFGTFELINIILSGYTGKIFPIHLKLDTVLGLKAYKSIEEVPEVPDLVIIVLPPKIVPQIFRECGEKGVKHLVVVSGGFREVTGEHANNLTEEITEIAKNYGMRFIGPNCFGFYNSWLKQEYGNIFNMMVFRKQEGRGKFSLASQSGTMASHLFMDPEYIDLNIGKTISVGNEADVDLVDFLEYFRDDDETNVIGLYIEEIKRGKKFVEVVKEINLKKPIIAMYGGGSGASNRAIKSHTGSMAGNTRIFDAMVKGTGIIKTNCVQEFLDLAVILSKPKVILPKGRRLGIITNSGGPGALIVKNAEKKGLLIPELSEELQGKLRNIVAPTASCSNPVDMTFDANMLNFYVSIPKIVMQSGEVDALIVYGAIGFQEQWSLASKDEKIGPYVQPPPIAGENPTKSFREMDNVFIAPIIKLSEKCEIPIYYINPQNYACDWSQRIRKQGGIVFKLWDAPVACLAKLCEYSEYLKSCS